MQDFFNNLDWMQLLRAFIVGGLICIIGQILIDKTKLTPARILVIFVSTGAILGGLRNISASSRFCRCRCNSSFNWFWKLISQRSYSKNSRNRFNWSFHWWNNGCCRWDFRCNILWIYFIINFKTKNEKTINCNYQQINLKRCSSELVHTHFEKRAIKIAPTICNQFIIINNNSSNKKEVETFFNF